MGRLMPGPPAAVASSISMVHRRRDQPIVSGALRRHDPIEPDKTPEEGYHFTEDMTDQGDQVDPPAKGADA